MIKRLMTIAGHLAQACALWLLTATSAVAATNCFTPTSQGTTGPVDWQTYCWIDFTSYNNTTASGTGGQNFSLTLQDGSVLAFNLQTTGVALTPIASPSYSGAAVGNTAMLGIGGKPILYATGAGNTTVTMSNITVTPPASGTGVTNYMIVMADGESTNSGESLAFTTNGGSWMTLDQAGPISGSAYPTLTGVGTSTVTETSTATGNVGAYIFGSSKPTMITAQVVSGGLQGFMVAVRFASIRLTMQIADTRVNAADQFTYSVNATANGSTFATGTSSGTTLGPFATTSLSTAASVPLSLVETMAAGSVSTLADYKNTLTCTNTNTGSPTPIPTNVATANFSLGSLSFGDALQCSFTSIPFPHILLQKALGTGGRQFASDQFVMNVTTGGTTVATTTTTGTGTTVASAATPLTLVNAGTAYVLSESGAGATAINQYTGVLACSNLYAASATKLPTTVGGTITPALGDVVSCTITNTKIATNAALTMVKTSAMVSDPILGSSNPKAIPGGIIRYTLTVANTGQSMPTANSVFVVDTLPTQISVGTASAPTFTQGSPSSGLTYAAANVAYSNSGTLPASFAACTYTPVSAYDPAVRYICLKPTGTFAGSTGTPPSFQFSYQALIN